MDKEMAREKKISQFCPIVLHLFLCSYPSKEMFFSYKQRTPRLKENPGMGNVHMYEEWFGW